MKRFPMVIGATVAGLAGILSFHTRATHALSNSLGVTAGTSANSNAGSTPPTTAATAPSGGPGNNPGTTPPPVNGSATGSSEQYGYGVLSVRVTVSGSKITDVQVVNLQTAESYSQQLANQVIPYLRQQVLSAQSSRINGISGATYTSEAYALSAQSALDQLHFQ
ncbi:MAG: FMN-binding protein [Acidimicrobiales bacterium]